MEEKTPILIRTTQSYYGEIQYSKYAIDEFNKRKLLIDPKFEPVSQEDYYSRRDPIMIDIVISMGVKNAVVNGGLKVEYIRKKYENYIQKTEFEGYEEFDYDLERYKLDEIKNICNSDDDEHTQMINIKNLLDADLYKDIWN
jgi:hypothetical protein